MSNNVVGSVYEQIIEDVLSTSRVDFEENGVDEGVLEELRRGWQRKLTQFNVAQFPWDPKPEPEAAAGNGTPAASSGKAGASSAAGKAASPPPSADNSFSQPTMSPMASQGLALPSLPMPAFEAPGVKTEDSTQSSGGGRIKTEPDTQNGSGLSSVPSAAGSQMPLPNAQPFPSAAGGPDSAAMRAAAMLSKEFGSAANASINAMNTQQQQQGRPAGGQPNNAQQYRAQMSAQAAAQLNGANGVARSQVDGSLDDGSLFEGVLLQQQRAGQPPVELGRMEIDDLLHEQMAQRAKQMEGGGLMLPLQQASQAQKQKRDRKRKALAAAAAGSSSSDVTGTSSQPRAATSIAQLDGIDDGDDEDVKADILDDEDAINSDLDDPEDDREDDDDDDDVMGPIMLCVYDKVQRVKNKWKCTLKDGVLTVNGKEYVFHKATGEYEW
ncbi:transcription factor IIA subunit alpha [Sporothrix stenoceras]|uniref:Transcription factor IIA subunit alpha n=1 Tax=Sporothrix stenoceras TaxID=5173 RepID=A0ABR3ZYH7_9PEZI